MRYIENISLDPYFNQAFEEYVFEHTEGDVLLLWRNRPAVVCGRFQNLYSEVNVWQAVQDQVALIRRISGGGTVYHDPGNVNYTLIGKSNPNENSFTQFLNPVIAVLAKMGIDAHIIPGNGLAIGDEKISGSAQRNVKGRTMHHGTLLFDADLTQLSRLANGRRSHFSDKGTQSAPWPVTNIKNHLPDSSITVEGFKETLLEHFGELYDLEHVELSQEDIRSIEQLARDKYHSFEWTFGKGPAFSCQHEVLINGKSVHMEYTSKAGIVTSITTIPRQIDLEEVLISKRLHPEEISQLLEEANLADWIPHFL